MKEIRIVSTTFVEAAGMLEFMIAMYAPEAEAKWNREPDLLEREHAILMCDDTFFDGVKPALAEAVLSGRVTYRTEEGEHGKSVLLSIPEALWENSITEEAAAARREGLARRLAIGRIHDAFATGYDRRGEPRKAPSLLVNACENMEVDELQTLARALQGAHWDLSEEK